MILNLRQQLRFSNSIRKIILIQKFNNNNGAKMNLRLNKLKIFGFIVLLFSINKINAQELNLGTDIVSRYIWRGIDLGANTPSIQPTVKFSVSGFAAGFWGAYAFSNPGALEEIDIFANYTLNISESGSFNLGITDYTNPNSGTRIGNIHNHDDAEGPGAHFIELNADYSGHENFPLSLSFNMFLYNVKNNPIYFQAGYSISIKNVVLSAFIGGTNGDNASYYGTDNFSIINVGFTATKTIKVTESFNFPLFGSVILNPASENLFYVVGISL